MFFNELRISKKQTVRVGLRDFKGKLYLDIRKWYDRPLERIPTRKGIMIDIINAMKVVKLAEAALIEYAKYQEGLVKEGKDEGKERL